jgi:hypothetical protein
MTTEHIDDETLALFAEGKLSRAELRPVVEHVSACASCRRIAKIAGAQSGVEEPRRVFPYWLAVAAAIAVVIAVPVVMRLRDSPTRQLIALSPRSARIVEPRLAGGFPWAPWQGAARAGDPAADAANLKLGGLAGELMDRADAKKTADAQHAAGAALLLAERPLDALPRLRDAADRAPNDARAWSDLAAAYYTAATNTGRDSLYPEALAAADRALRLDANFAEALFNRALILERMGAKSAARDAWERYLRVDLSSSWATEAREHLRRLAATTGEVPFKSVLPLLERAAADGDRARVAALVAKDPQMSRLFAEAEFMGSWAEAEQRGDASEAARQLTLARMVGAALEQQSGEALLADAMRAIDGATPEHRRVLAAAHAAYRRGRIAYSRQRLADAEMELRRAAALFASVNSPMSDLARYYAACTRYDQNDVASARAELASLIDDADHHPQWLALGAQLRWQLSLCFMSDDDWSGALALLRQSDSSFARLGERNHLGFIRSLLADALACVGRPDESWSDRIQAFTLQSNGRPDHYLAVSFGSAVRTALRAGRLDAARSMLDLEIGADRALKDDVLLAIALVRGTALDAALGDDASASRMAADATSAARRIGDVALRDRAMENAAFASGAALLHANPREARMQLTRAIDGYRQRDRAFFLPESFLLRARAARALGDLAAAADDLESGITELERHRIRYAGTVIGTGVFDAGRALFHDAIRLALQRGNPSLALGYAERSRPSVAAAPPVSVSMLQSRLRGSGTAVLEIITLPDETIAFCVTADALQVARTRIGDWRVVDLASRSVRGDRDALATLYAVLVRPCEKAIASSQRLIVVADPALDAVPFGGLYDAASGRYLVARMPVALSLSALSLNDGEPPAAHHLLTTVALPEGERGGSAGLPEVAGEIDDVRRLYARSVERKTFEDVLASRTDVLHIAGHTQVRSGSEERLLGFAAAQGEGREWTSWRRIARSRFLAGTTVVLAACETLRRPESSQIFALSLGGGFLAAGAGDVIGTLDTIGDRDAQRVFQAIHRQLANGADPAEAVRHAQLDALSQHPANPTAWFAVSVLTNRIRSSNSSGGT